MNCSLSVIVLLLTAVVNCYWCAFVNNKDCSIKVDYKGETDWTEYFITKGEPLTINATCKCSFKKPIWSYIINGSTNYQKVGDQYTTDHCFNNTAKCDKEIDTIKDKSYPYLYLHKELLNFPVNETTVLMCGNTVHNYARGIVIVISQAADDVTVPSTTRSVASCHHTSDTSISTTSVAVSTTSSGPSLSTSTAASSELPAATTSLPTSLSTSRLSTSLPTSSELPPPTTYTAAEVAALQQERDTLMIATVVVSVGLVITILVLVLTILVACRAMRRTRH